MEITGFMHTNVSKDGKVEGGGAVVTDGCVRLSKGDGCGLEHCHCSDGYSISITLPLNRGIVEGILVKFDDQEEMKRILKC